MANNLKKFTTEAEYTAATLNYPAVSWVTATDNVHFDKSAPTPPTVNDKVMMAWTSIMNGEDIVMYNGGSIIPSAGDFFNSITLNDVDVKSSIDEGVLHNYSVENTDYLAKYDISGTTVNDYFAGELGGGMSSNYKPVDFLVPSQITEIAHLPSNVGNLVVEAATPPAASFNWSAFEGVIYAPDNVISAYQTAWGGLATVLPISDYSGNLPV